MRRNSLARSRLLAAGLALAISAPIGAGAAELTRVASSADENNPFDLDLEIGFSRTQRRAKITRERHQDGHIADVVELRYHQVRQEMPMHLAIGLYKDLEIHVGTSLVLSDNKLWRFPGLDDEGNIITNANNSTIANNCINPDGSLTDPNCKGDSFVGASPIFNVPGSSYRAGLGNLTVGTTWAPLSDVRDDTKPKWILGFDYTFASADVAEPAKATTDTKPGEIGDGAHRLTFTTALSKRFAAIDPYVQLRYSLPVGADGRYSNCDSSGSLAWGVNCGVGPWDKEKVGFKPQHIGSLLFGAEFFPYDDPVKHQSVSIDLQLGGSYVSEGRTYNELSDALGKILQTEEYLTVGGTFGLNARPVEYVQLRLAASLHHETEHFLTGESIGTDLDDACQGDTSRECVDLNNASNEINPNFDFRYDMPGRRFRISETNVFTLMATGVVNF